MVTINEERCKGCGLCTEVCPKKILELRHDRHNSMGYYPVECRDNSKCISCMMCAVMCPDCVIKVEK